MYDYGIKIHAPPTEAPNTIETMKAMHINPSPSTMEMKKNRHQPKLKLLKCVETS
jgi:hypothetical protein